MKSLSYRSAGQTSYGIVASGGVVDLAPVADEVGATLRDKGYAPSALVIPGDAHDSTRPARRSIRRPEPSQATPKCRCRRARLDLVMLSCPCVIQSSNPTNSDYVRRSHRDGRYN